MNRARGPPADHGPASRSATLDPDGHRAVRSALERSSIAPMRKRRTSVGANPVDGTFFSGTGFVGHRDRAFCDVSGLYHPRRRRRSAGPTARRIGPLGDHLTPVQRRNPVLRLRRRTRSRGVPRVAQERLVEPSARSGGRRSVRAQRRPDLDQELSSVAPRSLERPSRPRVHHAHGDHLVQADDGPPYRLGELA